MYGDPMCWRRAKQIWKGVRAGKAVVAFSIQMECIILYMARCLAGISCCSWDHEIFISGFTCTHMHILTFWFRNRMYSIRIIVHILCPCNVHILYILFCAYCTYPVCIYNTHKIRTPLHIKTSLYVSLYVYMYKKNMNMYTSWLILYCTYLYVPHVQDTYTIAHIVRICMYLCTYIRTKYA